MLPKYLLLAGKSCTNNCVICCSRKEPYQRPYRIGKTTTEKRALEQLEHTYPRRVKR